jgi:TolA-binding protein
MNTANHKNEDLNKEIRNIRSRIDKLQGYQESQGKLLEQSKQQAISIFGTADVNAIREKITVIEDRNKKVLAFKARVNQLCDQVIGHIERKQIVPDELLADLQKALDVSTSHVAKQAAAQ